MTAAVYTKSTTQCMRSHTVREWADAEEWFNQYGALLGKYSLVFSNLFFALSLSTISEKTYVLSCTLASRFALTLQWDILK